MLLVGVGALLGLGALEGYLRLTANELPLTPGLVRTHPTRRYELVPRYQGRTYDKPIVINSLGLRDVETTEAKSPGLLRVICLGDSVTFGQGVSAGDTYPKQLERLLLRGAAAERAEVLNFGVPSYNTTAEVGLLRERGLRFAPDVVVLQFTVSNDAETLALPTPVGHAFFNTVKDRFRSLLLYDFLAWRYYAVAQRVTEGRQERVGTQVQKLRRDFGETNAGWHLVRTALEEFRTLSRRHRFVPIVMIFPVLDDLDQYAYGFAHARVRDAAGDEVEVVDGLAAFAGHGARRLWVSVHDGHPNPLAHTLMARALNDVLCRRARCAAPSARSEHPR